MIDTIKIFCSIPKNIFDLITQKGDCKCSYNKETGQLYYDITTNSLSGSFDGRLSVRPVIGSLYCLMGYVLQVEGSYHKFVSGQNSYGGFYNLTEIVMNIITYLNKYYNVKLPNVKHWFLQRCDIAICFNLQDNLNVCKYINNLSKCTYPRRNLKFYENESVYVSGTSTTLKIYNKLLEFRKNDMSKLKNTAFDVVSYMNTIKGYIRFECEIKKKKLCDLYKNKFVRVINVLYSDLENVWSDEFMKFLSIIDNDLTIVRDKDSVFNRLLSLYGKRRCKTLYSFYLSLLCEGKKFVKSFYCSSSYYYNLSCLKKAGIDISQSYKLIVDDRDIVDFDIFKMERVA